MQLFGPVRLFIFKNLKSNDPVRLYGHGLLLGTQELLKKEKKINVIPLKLCKGLYKKIIVIKSNL